MCAEFIEHGLIVGGLDHHGDVVMIFRRGADHRRAADVDILDAVLFAGALVHGRLERIEVDHEQIDWRDVVILHRLCVFGVVADRQQAAMHLGVQRLDPPVHHLRKPGELGDVFHLEPGLGDRLGGAAGGDQIDAVAGEGAGEVDQAGLVGNGKQCAGHAARSKGHEGSPVVRGLRASTNCCRAKPDR